MSIKIQLKSAALRSTVRLSGDGVAPLRIFYLGYEDLVCEPLLLEALANHPHCAEIYYIPMEIYRATAQDAIKERIVYSKQAQENSMPPNRWFKDYMTQPTEDVPAYGFPVRSLLQRHGGPALSSAMVGTRIRDHIASHTKSWPELSTADGNCLINGTHEAHLSAYFSRRLHNRGYAALDNDPINAMVANDKRNLPVYAKQILKQEGEYVIPLCKVVESTAQLVDLMKRNHLREMVVKEPHQCAGRGIYRVFFDENDQLLAECANRKERYQPDQPTPSRFSPTDRFVPAGGMLAMEWLDTSKGDIRAVIINGECVGAYVRHAAPDSWVCNYSQGGSIHPVDLKRDLSRDDRARLDAVARYLKKQGVHRAAVDLLANHEGARFVSEINIGTTDDLVELHAHDLGQQASQGKPALPDQIANRMVDRFLDVQLVHALAHKEYKVVPFVNPSRG